MLNLRIAAVLAAVIAMASAVSLVVAAPVKPEVVTVEFVHNMAAGTVTGTVTNKSGDKPEGIKVNLHGLSIDGQEASMLQGKPDYTATTEKEGKFTISNVKPQGYRIIVGKRGSSDGFGQVMVVVKDGETATRNIKLR